jgi:hypothetical protein
MAGAMTADAIVARVTAPVTWLRLHPRSAVRGFKITEKKTELVRPPHRKAPTIATPRTYQP